jgi:class 3 adenylate cyclase
VQKIRTGQRRLAGERKHVTVVFADVTGSMALAESVDPEAWQRIMDRFFALLCDGVHPFEGTVNKFTGDGIMALFGAPIAHEDHAPGNVQLVAVPVPHDCLDGFYQAYWRRPHACRQAVQPSPPPPIGAGCRGCRSHRRCRCSLQPDRADQRADDHPRSSVNHQRDKYARRRFQ